MGNKKAIGSLLLYNSGGRKFLKIKISETQSIVYHKKVWMDYHGKEVPDGYVVTFIDDAGSDPLPTDDIKKYRIKNLELKKRGYHLLNIKRTKKAPETRLRPDYHKKKPTNTEGNWVKPWLQDDKPIEIKNVGGPKTVPVFIKKGLSIYIRPGEDPVTARDNYLKKLESKQHR